MPSLLLRLLVSLYFLCGLPVQAANQASTPFQPDHTIILDDRTPTLQVTTDIESWIDEGSRANIELVARSSNPSQP